AIERFEAAVSEWNEQENNVWNDVKNLADPKKAESSKRAEYFIARSKFLLDVFEGNPMTSQIDEQQEFSLTLSQKYEENGEEICTNKIDDNNNEKIDCADNLCSGQVCGTQTITEGNDTREEELYCISGTCQALQITTKTAEPVCGNKICEENEEATCSQDCVTCPVYENKECAGDLVDTGYDSNHCALEPVCVISNQGVCTEDSQCPQPLCAKASCVEGQCINAELKECIPAQCIEGETKTKICDASTIIISRCVKGNWEETDQTCPVLATTPPIKTTTQTTPTTPQTTKACSVKSDCGGDSNACVAGQCTTLTKKIIPLTEKTLAQDTKINGISVTGQIISITSEGIGLTSEGITSIIGENPDLTTPPQEYKRPTTLPEDAGGSFLTGVAREENTQEEVGDFVPSQTIEEVEILAVTEGLSDEFRATGVCKTTNGETESYLKFTGGGEIFSDINYLLNQYQTGGAEWTNFELENLLEQRRILEESFNLDFVKWFFNDYLTENAENWEQAEDPINDLYNQLVENQMQIAYAMESAGIIELETYNPITIDYETEYGSLHYSEPIGLVRLPGMQTSVKILSPEIKLFILPNQEFIIREQEKAMNQKTFPGSEVTAIQRTLSKGLTPEEKTAVSQDQELVKELEALSSQTIDGILDIKISVEDSEKIVYNLYVTIDGSKIRAQPLLPGETPLTDAEITIPFADFYSLIQKSMEHSYIQKSPWNEGKGLFERINDAIGSISLYFNTNGFMNSIKISSKTIPEGEIRSAFKQIFFIVEDNSKRK
ncbi:MAG: hypothetical protein KKB31_01520, partial [Nanoarchaeota archaeon]|nr:hypothetical protein [Nanoarchaeota archaeon]